jgi:hypothetical protein
MAWTALRIAALACVALAVSVALSGPHHPACRTDVGACAQPGVARCGASLGDWRVARTRESGLPPGSNSACILASAAGAMPPDGDPAVSIVPQDPAVPGDTLLSLRPATHLEQQQASLRLAIRGNPPDHWVFGVAGTFLDRGDRSGCPGLRIMPPVNAAYAIIGGNWQRRPHGFYFERLVDACVYDGRNPACPGDAPSIAHEFVAGEVFALDLSLTRTDADGWRLRALVAAVDENDPAQPARELGRMQLAVDPPCWLEPGEPGRALVVVIPHPDPAERAGARVDVSRLAWR